MVDVAVKVSSAETSDYASRSTTKISRTTKCLSAAAYVDSKFRNRVLTLSGETLKAAAPELGLDIDAVKQHCYSASRRHVVKHLLLLIPLIWFLSSGIIRYFFEYPSELAGIIYFYKGTVFIVLLLSTIIVFSFYYWNEQITLAGIFSTRNIDGSTVPATGNVGNVVIYGAFSPFVGSGFDVGGYSFTVNLEQARVDAESISPKAFEVGDLYDFLKKSFEKLALDSLQVEESLFVDGQSIRDDPLFLPDPFCPPRIKVDEQYIAFFRANPTKVVRYYLIVRVVDWSGEIATSMFIRIWKNNSKMFVENSIFLLPPLKRKYHILENISLKSPLKKNSLLAAKALVSSPFLAVLTPVILMGEVSEAWGRFRALRRQRREASENFRFNYGALQSIREIGMENNWRVYFQKLDYQMSSKIIQQQFIDSLVNYLDDHGYETADIKNRGNQIFNNGVMISGGSIQAENLAVGHGAQARKSDGNTKSNSQL